VNSLTLNRFNASVARFNEVEGEAMLVWQSNCGCSAPGSRIECWDCPYYKQLGHIIQKKLHPESQKIFAEIPPPELKDPYSDEVKQLCCQMYLNGYLMAEIQRLVGIPSSKVLRAWLRGVGLPKRSGNYPEHLKQQCLGLYADGWAVSHIENETGVPADAITDWALQAGLSRHRKYSDETKQKCLELYQAGHTSDDIHAMTGIHAVTIRAWIAKASIGRGQKHYSEQEKQNCLLLYLQGKSPREIEALTSIKAVTIRSWIRKERLQRGEDADRFRQKCELAQTAEPERVRKPNGYWKNLNNVIHEIRLLNEVRGQIGKMPTACELQKLERSDLQHAISDHHGGFQAVAEQMHLIYRTKKTGYWHNFENLKQELFTYIREHGNPGVMPTKQELEQAEKTPLAAALTLHGGVAAVAKKLNLKLSYARKPRGYWKTPDNLAAEIASVAELLGNPGVVPTHEELKQIGRTDLISAIADNGGWPSVARKLGFSYVRHYINPNDYFGGETKKEQKPDEDTQVINGSDNDSIPLVNPKKKKDPLKPLSSEQLSIQGI